MLASTKATGGESSAKAISSMKTLAHICDNTDKCEEAVELYTKLIAFGMEDKRPLDEGMASDVQSLSSLYLRRGDAAAAEALAASFVSKLVAQLGNDHPLTLQAAYDLMQVLACCACNACCPCAYELMHAWCVLVYECMCV